MEFGVRPQQWPMMPAPQLSLFPWGLGSRIPAGNTPEGKTLSEITTTLIEIGVDGTQFSC